MINIVLDTNIIISAAISSSGNPAKIIKLIAINQNIHFYYSSDIFAEYIRVLSYKRLNFSEEKKIHTINIIKKYGVPIQPTTVSDIPFIDESDRIFYDTAKAINAYLITGNIKHYPEEPHILTPAQFVEMFEK